MDIQYQEGFEPDSTLLTYLASLFSIAALYTFFSLLISFLKMRWLRISLHLFLLYLLAFPILFHLGRNEPLTFILLLNYGLNLLYWESVQLVFENLAPYTSAILITLGIVLYGEISFKILSKSPDFFKSQRKFLIPLSFILGLSGFFIPLSYINSWTAFADSIANHQRGHESDLTQEWEKLGLYPYLQSQQSKMSMDTSEAKPHVFIVMLESFSSLFMEGHRENNKIVTPFIDSLIQHGLYVENFFSNAEETSKGQFAVFCGVIPSFKTNVFPTYDSHNFRCLPEIMQELGYETVLMKAYHSMLFENTGPFMSKNGITHALGMDARFISEAERKEFKWGWGIQDNLFYKKVFGFLDDLKDSLDQHGGKPLFVSTMSVTNHMMFNKTPESQKFIYPGSKDQEHRKNYSNTLYLTDHYLREFFNQFNKRPWLKNSIIVITGDNGFPMGQHKNYMNTKTFYNELFKTPLLILWPQKIEPKRITDRAHSHIDVAPTLIDLLNISSPHHFIGTSILDTVHHPVFVPLIQPWDGTFISSIRWPYKKTLRLSNQKQYLFNLKEDPNEAVNLISSSQLNRGLIDTLDQDLKRIQFNELLLKENRIWSDHPQEQDIRIRLSKLRLHHGEPLHLEVLGPLQNTWELQISHWAYHGSERFKKSSFKQSVYSGDNSLDSEFLNPGLNKLVFEEKTSGYQLIQDVYVYSADVRLVSDMDLEGHQGWGKLGIDLPVKGSELRIHDNIYQFGLGSHAPHQWALKTKKNYSRFYAQIGINDRVNCGDGAYYEIWGDQRLLIKSRRISQNMEDTLDVDITGVEVLSLVTQEGRDKKCDHTNWINAFIEK
jgi:arylsulfatase A-like enzyme